MHIESKRKLRRPNCCKNKAGHYIYGTTFLCEMISTYISKSGGTVSLHVGRPQKKGDIFWLKAPDFYSKLRFDCFLITGYPVGGWC